MSFPERFWWGTASSSTQCEGAAPASDWAAWEDAERVPRSGSGNDFHTRYAEDFAAFAALGLRHHRLSLEWARLEPQEGERDALAIERYRSLLRAARDAGISVWVCLHHFSLPRWFVARGGFLDASARHRFWARHVDFVAETFGDLVFGWKPVNEPVAYAGAGWLVGGHPPGERSFRSFVHALEATHLAAHEAWRRLRSVPWSEGLELVARRLGGALPKRELLVSEHGVGTVDDACRAHILTDSLTRLARCIEDGIPVRGFFHWTGVDNYEWTHGYDVSFGLLDRQRRLRPSAEILRCFATRTDAASVTSGS